MAPHVSLGVRGAAALVLQCGLIGMAYLNNIPAHINGYTIEAHEHTHVNTVCVHVLVPAVILRARVLFFLRSLRAVAVLRHRTVDAPIFLGKVTHI